MHFMIGIERQSPRHLGCSVYVPYVRAVVPYGEIPPDLADEIRTQADTLGVSYGIGRTYVSGDGRTHQDSSAAMSVICQFETWLRDHGYAVEVRR